MYKSYLDSLVDKKRLQIKLMRNLVEYVSEDGGDTNDLKHLLDEIRKLESHIKEIEKHF
jgi:division protein CdvB (Snf7/Vps24/ESCRT-III family)